MKRLGVTVAALLSIALIGWQVYILVTPPTFAQMELWTR